MYPHTSTAVEVAEITNSLAAVLDEAAIELPQFHGGLAPNGSRESVIRLGDCDVRQGRALLGLLLDGLVLRQKHADEHPTSAPVRPVTRERRPDDLLARLKSAFREAGWLVDLEVIQTAWGPRLAFRDGLGLDHADELILTVQAGVRARVIKA
ncbi:hypothetical protein ACF09H_26345 [Streptomyces sp. NPDC014983]|uniref:hypothetical protein n=1 Tax=Streptomyces sp. NPDC014983 TaxID=3364933 RepID=UPI003700D078